MTLTFCFRCSDLVTKPDSESLAAIRTCSSGEHELASNRKCRDFTSNNRQTRHVTFCGATRCTFLEAYRFTVQLFVRRETRTAMDQGLDLQFRSRVMGEGM